MYIKRFSFEQYSEMREYCKPMCTETTIVRTIREPNGINYFYIFSDYDPETNAVTPTTDSTKK